MKTPNLNQNTLVILVLSGVVVLLAYLYMNKPPTVRTVVRRVPVYPRFPYTQYVGRRRWGGRRWGGHRGSHSGSTSGTTINNTNTVTVSGDTTTTEPTPEPTPA